MNGDIIEFLLMSVYSLLRKITKDIGPGISQIIQTLMLSDLSLESSGNKDKKRQFEVSNLILDTLTYVFTNFDLFIDFINDDFEGILNILINLTNKYSLDIVYKAVKLQEELFFLFWEPEEVTAKYGEALTTRFRAKIGDSTKVYFANDNIYFQSKLSSVHPQSAGQLEQLRPKELGRRFQASNQQDIRDSL